MKNFVQIGDAIDYTNATGADIKSGDVIVIGKRVAIAAVDIADGATGTVDVYGVFRVAKAAATAIGQGALVYWDATNKVANTTATSNTLLGFATAAAAADDTSVEVKLNA